MRRGSIAWPSVYHIIILLYYYYYYECSVFHKSLAEKLSVKNVERYSDDAVFTSESVVYGSEVHSHLCTWIKDTYDQTQRYRKSRFWVSSERNGTVKMLMEELVCERRKKKEDYLV